MVILNKLANTTSILQVTGLLTYTDFSDVENFSRDVKRVNKKLICTYGQTEVFDTPSTALHRLDLDFLTL